MERQEARIRAERLDTSQHGKEETRLTRIRDINERTATRAGDLGYMMGGVQVMMDRRTQDEKTPKGGDHGEEDPGGMGQGQDRGPLHRAGEGETWGCSWGGDALEKGSSEQCWGRGRILKEEDIPGRGKPKRGPHQFHPRSPCPAPLPCSVSRMH